MALDAIEIKQRMLKLLDDYKKSLGWTIDKRVKQDIDERIIGNLDELPSFTDHSSDDRWRNKALVEHKYFLATVFKNWIEPLSGEELTQERVDSVLRQTLFFPGFIGAFSSLEDFMAIRRNHFFWESKDKQTRGTVCIEKIRELMLQLPRGRVDQRVAPIGI